jgi:hypothetical protein
MSNNFKPIHFYNHSTNESFQITSRKGLINWINDFTENHNAFDSYEQLKERCLEREKMKVKDLIKTLKKFDDNDEVIFYHLKNHNLESCKFESVIETELGVELTIEGVSDE